MKRDWTIVTVTHNSAIDLREYSATYDTEGPTWIVVDNDSEDDTLEIAASKGASKVLSLKSNLGFSKANNLGLAEVSTKYVAFVNPDVTLNFNTLDELDPKVFENSSIAAPQLLYPDGQKQPNGRNFPFLAFKISNRVNSLRDLRKSYQIYAHENESVEVAWLTGAVIMGKTETFRRLGGWPEKYFLYYEDIDFCLSVRKNGGSVTLIGQHQWVHGWRRETSKLRVRPWARELSSMAKFYFTHSMFLRLPSQKALEIAKRAYGKSSKWL